MKNFEKRSTTTTTRFEAGVMITVALLVLLLLAVLILPGCVAQEYEYCPPRLVIITDQDAGLYGEPAETRAQSRARYVDEWFDCIDSIHVYIFDENERFVTIWSGGEYTPGQEYEVPYDKLGLPEGVYSFVAWTNRWGDHTCNVNELLAQGGDFYLDDLHMYLDTHGGEIDHDLNHRHWGILERANMSNQSVISPSEYRIVIDPAIHRVNFMLEGVEVDRPGQTRVDAEDYSVTVSDNNPVHNFRNKYVTGQPTYYHTRTMMDVTGAPGGPGAWFDDEGIPPAGADYKDGVALLTASMNLVPVENRLLDAQQRLGRGGIRLRRHSGTDKPRVQLQRPEGGLRGDARVRYPRVVRRAVLCEHQHQRLDLQIESRRFRAKVDIT